MVSRTRDKCRQVKPGHGPPCVGKDLSLKPTDVKHNSRPSKIILRMQEEVLAAREKIEHLAYQHDRLTYRCSVLSAMCEALDWARQHQAKAKTGKALQCKSIGLASAEELRLLEQLKALDCLCSHDASLTQQMPPPSSPSTLGSSRVNNFGDRSVTRSNSLNSSNSSQESPATSARHQQAVSSSPWTSRQQQQQEALVQRISPATQPLWLMGHVMSLPPPPAAVLADFSSKLTPNHLLVEYEASVHKLALHLHRCTPIPAASSSGQIVAASNTQASSNAAQERMIRELCRHLQLLLLIRQHHEQQGQLVNNLMLANLETGSFTQEPSRLHQLEALARLGLSHQQQQDIADGLALARSLADPILQDMHALVRELAAADEEPALAAASDFRPTQPHDMMVAIGRKQQLPLQLERFRKLERLLRKEWMLMFAFECHTFGCLSWQQLATLMVHSYPGTLNAVAFASEVSNQAEAARKQELAVQARMQQKQQRQRQQHATQPQLQQLDTPEQQLVNQQQQLLQHQQQSLQQQQTQADTQLHCRPADFDDIFGDFSEHYAEMQLPVDLYISPYPGYTCSVLPVTG